MFEIIPLLIDTVYRIVLRIHYGNISFPSAMWNILKPSSNQIARFLKIATLINICLGIYFMTLFIPFNKKCHGYDHNMCTSFRIASVIEMSKITYFCGKILLYVIMFYMSNMNNIHINQNVRQPSDILITNIRREIINELPITTTPPDNDNACSICLEIKEDDAWKQLQCGHRFHPACIETWLLQAGNCPLCRNSLLQIP
jgi:hypothetical protein